MDATDRQYNTVVVVKQMIFLAICRCSPASPPSFAPLPLCARTAEIGRWRKHEKMADFGCATIMIFPAIIDGHLQVFAETARIISPARSRALLSPRLTLLAPTFFS